MPDATERKEVEQGQEILLAVARILAESTTLDEAARRFLQAVGEPLGWEVGELWIVEPEDQELHLVDCWHVPTLDVAEFLDYFQKRRVAPRVCLMGQAWRSERPVWYPDVTREASFARRELAARAGLRTGFAVPILLNRRVLGVMAFYKCPSTAADERLIARMESLGIQLGQFLARKQAEDGQVRFRLLMDSAHDGIEVIDPDTGRYLDVNAQACRMHGYTREEYLARSVPDISLSARPWPRAQVLEDLAHGRSRVLFARHRRRDGSLFPVEVKVSFVRVKRPYMIAVVRDVTERQRTQELLTGQNELLKAIALGEPLEAVLTKLARLLEALSEGLLCSVLLLDRDGIHVRRGAAPSLPEAHLKAIEGQPIGPRAGSCGTAMYLKKPVVVSDIAHDSLWEDYRHLALEHELRACWSTPILSSKGAVLGSLAMYYRTVRGPDPTERHLADVGASIAGIAIEHYRAEEDLHHSQERYRILVENLNDVLFACDAQGNLTYISSVIERLTGYKPDELVGQPCCRFIHPEEIPELQASFASTLAGQTEPSEFRILDKKGTELWVRTSSRPQVERGRVVGITGVLTNITERKRAEQALRQLEEQFRQAQKMEAVGRLAGGIAHDFNNLLTAINGYSELIANTLAPNDPNREAIDQIKTAGTRAATLTRQLLAFSRKQLLQPQVVNLKDLLENLHKLLQRLIGEDIEISLRLEPDLGLVKVDPGQFEQAIINMAVNARDAMSNGGRLTIGARNVELDEDSTARHAGLNPGSYVLVALSDTGHGMDAATRARIFEPFFTTKDIGKGTGLGLAMVYGFVMQSGGHIEVASEVGQGATFHILLPRTERVRPSARSSPNARPLPRGSETILLVEDEDGVRTFSRIVLEANGYTVLEASHGAEALRLAREHSGPIDLLLTDLVMPQMSGRQLADQLLEARPGMRVLFISGYTEDAPLLQEVLQAGVQFLHKPFNRTSLTNKVRAVLDAPEGC